MTKAFLIGLDYGSESARGVLVDADTGEQVASHIYAYSNGIMTRQLPNGTRLPRGWALQDAADYLNAAETILTKLGDGRNIASIGIGFTASSPLPSTADGTALSELWPGNPHAYVKLWKHGSAQPYADNINVRGGRYLDNFGGKVSGEWLLAKAMQIADEAPDTWAKTDKFIEGGDWLVWRLTGNEARSLGFAAYKAQYVANVGYPGDVLPNLETRLAEPLPIGSPAGSLTAEWRERTGIMGEAVVAVAAIDSHVVLPAVGGVSGGTLVGALGTSAAYLLLSDHYQPLPAGIEGVAKDGSIRDLWCYEAGQASFGDTLSWFVRNFPRAETEAESFRLYNEAAASMPVGNNRLLALDWWNGNRVPFADSRLSGLLLGLGMETTSVGIYRALMDAICFGARSIIDLFSNSHIEIEQLTMTSGLALNNPSLVQTMCDVIGRPIAVPAIVNSTAVGAAIHGAVAGGVVENYREGSGRFGTKEFHHYEPIERNVRAYEKLYKLYRDTSNSKALRETMHGLNEIVSSAEVA